MKGWYFRKVDDGLSYSWIGTDWYYHSESRTAQEFLRLAKEGVFNKNHDNKPWYRLEVSSATVISDHEFLIELFDVETNASEGMVQFKVFESNPDGEEE